MSLHECPCCEGHGQVSTDTLLRWQRMESGHETRASAVLEMYEHLAVGVEACPNCPTCQRNAEETLKAHRESGQKASAPLNCDCPNGSYGKKHRADCALKASAPQKTTSPCGCDSPHADYCRRGDLMTICGCECHGKATVYETCSRCGGSGLGLNMAGEPDECPQCKGNAVCAQNGSLPQGEKNDGT